ncbi:hypothetical protein DL764_006331 [Monosporascus ibericus]|uniref:lytic cellulose monooxygenase (C4-dehydrogenating) n=1 Tax=Monosporascus ibericus TaxID=155417 RepID=A0A4Q4T5C6_9PEZI|nr:hypothetical protein DL764_006331 [Monosporascus ibericus]
MLAPFTAGSIRNFTFTLPSALASGQYLIRGKHIALHSGGEYEGAQFYIGCAQLGVTDNGNGNPGPLVKFPDAYTGYEEGIIADMDWPLLRHYNHLGPLSWPNKAEGN